MWRLLIGAVAGAAMLTMSGGRASAGDAEAGRQVFIKECRACHSMEADRQLAGPSLAGMIGRPAASVPDFTAYSSTMREMAANGLVWSVENLRAYFLSPKTFVRDGTMAYVGLSKAPRYKLKPDKAVDDLIAYMATFE